MSNRLLAIASAHMIAASAGFDIPSYSLLDDPKPPKGNKRKSGAAGIKRAAKKKRNKRR